MNKNKYILGSIALVSLIVIVAVLPLLSSNKPGINDIMAFYGGYLGAIFGLIGVIISIFHSSNEAKQDRINTLELAKEERRHSKMPFIKIEDIGNVDRSEAFRYPQLTFGQNKTLTYTTTFRLLRFKNIGTGPATDFKLNSEKISVVRDNIVECDINGKFQTSLLDQGDFFDICIIFNEKNHLLQSILSSQTPYVFTILSEYKDMFDNKYNQEFRFAYKLALKYSTSTKKYMTIFLNDYLNIEKPKYLY